MIDWEGKLSVKRQCELLELNRSGVYYTPCAVSEQDLQLMRRIDQLHLDYPFYGSRRIAKQLAREGFDTGRLHVATLMRRMGIEALYRKPRTSIPAPRATELRCASALFNHRLLPAFGVRLRFGSGR